MCPGGGHKAGSSSWLGWEDTEEGVRRRRAEPGPAEGWRRQTPRGPSAPPPPPGAPPSPSSSRCLASSGSSAPASAAVAGRGRGGGASGGRGSRHPRGSRSGAEIPARRGRNPRGGRTKGSEPQGPGGTGGWAETRLSCPGSHAAHGAPSLVMVGRGGGLSPRPSAPGLLSAPTPSSVRPSLFLQLRILRDRPERPPGLASPSPSPSRAPCWSHRFLPKASWSLCLAAWGSGGHS